ncbi:hypothetical protein PAMA_015463 [Pampus argenteus]
MVVWVQQTDRQVPSEKHSGKEANWNKETTGTNTENKSADLIRFLCLLLPASKTGSGDNQRLTDLVDPSSGWRQAAGGDAGSSAMMAEQGGGDAEPVSKRRTRSMTQRAWLEQSALALYLNIETSVKFSEVFPHIELANAVTARCWLLLEIVKGHQFVSSRPTSDDDQGKYLYPKFKAKSMEAEINVNPLMLSIHPGSLAGNDVLKFAKKKHGFAINQRATQQKKRKCIKREYQVHVLAGRLAEVCTSVYACNMGGSEVLSPTASYCLLHHLWLQSAQNSLVERGKRETRGVKIHRESDTEAEKETGRHKDIIHIPDDKIHKSSAVMHQETNQCANKRKLRVNPLPSTHYQRCSMNAHPTRMQGSSVHGAEFGHLPDNITVLEGESVTLRCRIDEEVTHKAWLNRSNILFTGTDKWSLDKRVTLVNSNNSDFSIHIDKVQVTDEGPYTCTFQANNKPRIAHVYLIVQEIKRQQAEDYECITNNGVAPPDQRKVKVTVNYPPMITDMKNMPAHLGKTAILRCEAMAVPPASFEWYRDDHRPVESDNTLRIKNEKTRSLLLFTNVTEKHFGNYTCFASNRLGASNASMLLFRKLSHTELRAGTCNTVTQQIRDETLTFISSDCQSTCEGSNRRTFETA